MDKLRRALSGDDAECDEESNIVAQVCFGYKHFMSAVGT